MKITSKIKSFLGLSKKNSEENNTFQLTDSSEGFFLGRAFNFTNNSNFLLEAYGTNPFIFMVVDKIATLTSRFPYKYEDKENKDTEPIVPDDLSALMQNPNSKETYKALKKRALSTYLVTGEAFVCGISGNVEGLPRVAEGEVHEMFCPVNYNVTIEESITGEVLGYSVEYFNRVYKLEPNEVMHIYDPNILKDSNSGFSKLNAGRRVWETDNENWKNEYSLLKNQGIRGVLYTDGGRPMSPDERKKRQKEFDTEYGNNEKFAKVRFNTERMGYVNLAVTPKDMVSDENRWSYLRVICGLYGIDSKLFNDPKASTYNNYSEAKEGMYTDVLLPLDAWFNDELTRWLLVEGYDIDSFEIVTDENDIPFIKIMKSKVLFETKKLLSEKLINEVNAGIITTAEAYKRLYEDEK